MDQEPIQAPPIPAPAEPISPSSKTNFPLILTIIVLLVVVGAGGLILGKSLNTSQPSPPPTATPTPLSRDSEGILRDDPTASWKTYTDEEYGFEFKYPNKWQLTNALNNGVSLTNIADGHTINITVWRVTGFGYCYQYNDKKQVIVGNKTAETADGIGGTDMCDRPKQEMSTLGNTYVLIPIDKAESLPINQIHISYDYPLKEIKDAKSNLDQILSTFKFLQ